MTGGCSLVDGDLGADSLFLSLPHACFHHLSSMPQPSLHPSPSLTPTPTLAPHPYHTLALFSHGVVMVGLECIHETFLLHGGHCLPPCLPPPPPPPPSPTYYLHLQEGRKEETDNRCLPLPPACYSARLFENGLGRFSVGIEEEPGTTILYTSHTLAHHCLPRLQCLGRPACLFTFIPSFLSWDRRPHTTHLPCPHLKRTVGVCLCASPGLLDVLPPDPHYTHLLSVYIVEDLPPALNMEAGTGSVEGRGGGRRQEKGNICGLTEGEDGRGHRPHAAAAMTFFLPATLAGVATIPPCRGLLLIMEEDYPATTTLVGACHRHFLVPPSLGKVRKEGHGELPSLLPTQH